MNNKIQLLIEATPYPDESATSYLLRTAELNGHTSVYQLFGKEKFSFLSKSSPNYTFVDTNRFRYALQTLNLNPDYIDLAFERDRSTSRAPRKYRNVYIDRHLFKSKSYSYCPQCLIEQPYFRKLWLLRPVYACPIHSILLLDNCYKCGHAIQLRSGSLVKCSNCLTDLREAQQIHYVENYLVHWFIYILNQNSNELFQEFTSFWFALEKFSALDEPRSDEYYLKIVHEYFVNNANSVITMGNWINNRIHLAHPKIQLLPFYKEAKSIRFKDNYLVNIEKICIPYKPNPQSKKIYLTFEESRLLLDIGRFKLKNLLIKNLLKFAENVNDKPLIYSTDIELFLIGERNLNTEKSIIIPTPQDKLLTVTVKLAAEILDTNLDTMRRLARSHWLNDDSNKNATPILIPYYKLENFHEKYVIATTLAKKIGVYSGNFVEKMISIGIKPISGPHIDKLPINIFSKDSIQHVTKDHLDQIKKYPTKTGRKNNDSQIQINNDFYTLNEAALLLKISPNQVSTLTHLKVLNRYNDYLTPIKIKHSSLDALKNILESEDYVSIQVASEKLNCRMNWLNQYWCKTGFLDVKDLIYWKLVKKDQLDEIIKLKEEYLTGAEASSLLGMRHSHVTNLQNQGLITPYYFGKADKKIRLFKRADIYQIKNNVN
ncbi:TniQ family protein [Acinetobacter wuhouensis]|uniref:TniQ domain-containing protein n=1 Tax=Acinetobacter wuhouensis TaxID=1879050 RepID=A0A4Q7AGA2_9GAMM|nr:TniQ family protein [Acinetobacter wuhouensis]RZG43277.1 hypothetical protein EXU28_17720 [Acinetobacter wuhouensis]